MSSTGGPELGGRYTPTPFGKRLPTVLAIGVSLAVAMIFGGSGWGFVGLFLLCLLVCVLVLRYAFHQPWDRLLSYKDFEK